MALVSSRPLLVANLARGTLPSVDHGRIASYCGMVIADRTLRSVGHLLRRAGTAEWDRDDRYPDAGGLRRPVCPSPARRHRAPASCRVARGGVAAHSTGRSRARDDRPRLA